MTWEWLLFLPWQQQGKKVSNSCLFILLSTNLEQIHSPELAHDSSQHHKGLANRLQAEEDAGGAGDAPLARGGPGEEPPGRGGIDDASGATGARLLPPRDGQGPGGEGNEVDDRLQAEEDAGGAGDVPFARGGPGEEQPQSDWLAPAEYVGVASIRWGRGMLHHYALTFELYAHSDPS